MQIIITGATDWFGLALLCLLIYFVFYYMDHLSSGRLCSVAAGFHSLAFLVMLVHFLALQRKNALILDALVN